MSERILQIYRYPTYIFVEDKKRYIEGFEEAMGIFRGASGDLAELRVFGGFGAQ